MPYYHASSSPSVPMYNFTISSRGLSEPIEPRFFRQNSASTDVLDKKRTYFSQVLQSYSKLENGWNGDQAQPISDKVIHNAENLLQCIQTQRLEIFPTGRKSIQFEYDNGRRSLEIEIFEDRYEVALFDEANLVYELLFKLNETDSVSDHIAKLYES